MNFLGGNPVEVRCANRLKTVLIPRIEVGQSARRLFAKEDHDFCAGHGAVFEVIQEVLESDALSAIPNKDGVFQYRTTGFINANLISKIAEWFLTFEGSSEGLFGSEIIPKTNFKIKNKIFDKSKFPSPALALPCLFS